MTDPTEDAHPPIYLVVDDGTGDPVALVQGVWDDPRPPEAPGMTQYRLDTIRETPGGVAAEAALFRRTLAAPDAKPALPGETFWEYVLRQSKETS